MPRFTDPERLNSSHLLSGFDCGEGALNAWLEAYARVASGANSARTYVVVDGDQGRVVGYHALSLGSISHEQATARSAKGMPRHPIPVVLLARLAVDETVKGMGIGATLLVDAMMRAVAVSDEVAARTLLAHALTPDARRFYEHFGFEASPSDPLNMQLLISDIRRSLTAGG
jgi:GNAT superfamily N-acetyltransferase